MDIASPGDCHVVLGGQCEPILNSVRSLDIVITRDVRRVLIDLCKLQEVRILEGAYFLP